MSIHPSQLLFVSLKQRMVSLWTTTRRPFILSSWRNLLSVSTLLFHSSHQSLTLAMTWTQTWNDNLSGGPTRWKVDDISHKQQALQHIVQHHSSPQPLHILCPLAGDDPFVHYAWSQGHSVTSIDLVPAAVAEMRRQFGPDSEWTQETIADNTVVWKHASNRATLLQGDMLQKRPALQQMFDAVYDKDSFGALDIELREPFSQRLAELCKPGAILYTEVKNKAGGYGAGGPPYHVEQADLVKSLGADFEHVRALGEVYPLPMPGMTQTGHILQRKDEHSSVGGHRAHEL